MTLLTLGCSDNSILESEGKLEDSLSMDFSCYTSKSTATRTNSNYLIDGTNNTTIPNGNSIGTFCFYQGSTKWDDITSHVASFMNNQQMVAKTSNNTVSFTYSPTKYWPNNANDKLSFFAYYPWNNLSNGSLGIGIENIEDASKMCVRVNVKNNPSEQIDFMLSDLIKDKTYQDTNNEGKVSFVFHHILSLVNIKLIIDNEMKSIAKLNVNSASISGLYNAGTCHPSYDQSSTKTAFTWTPYFKTGTSTQQYALDASSISSTSSSQTGNILLMVPQQLNTNVIFTISYDIIFIDSNGNEKYRYTNNEENVVLKNSGNITEWLSGKRYNYTFTLGLKPIKMDATYDEWSNSGYDADIKNTN